MIPFIIIFSFLFEATFSNIVGITSILIPLFTLISLSILYPYFKKNIVTFIVVCSIVGLFYDLIFTNAPFINTVSFMIMSFLIILNYRIFKHNIVSLSIFNIILVVLYRIVSYILLVLIDYTRFSFKTLMIGIYSSLIVNVIYGIILYIILGKLSRVLEKKR